MADRFMACLPFVLTQEGRPGTKPGDWVNQDGTLNAACWSDHRNFSNDAHDPGGETMNGIIQREYSGFRNREGLPSQNVINISIPEGMQIYRFTYWTPRCTALPFGFDLSYFDADVNEGEHEATKMLQYCIGAPVDGLWGAVTDTALTNYLASHAPAELITAYRDRRLAVYRMMPGFRYFGGDWDRRANQIALNSLGHK